jgi:predicted ATPase
MNPLFSLPLHGIACNPFCVKNSAEAPFNIQLEFNQIDLEQSEKPQWSLIDQGERYQSEVLLFKGSPNKEEKKEHKKSTINQNDTYYLSVNCQGNGLFKINNNNITVDWQANGTNEAHYFQTLAAALYLELNDILCLHANALAFKDNAVAFVAPSRTGKTTLTTFLSQHGFSMMTDDMMALHYNEKTTEYIIYPSWPVARMWPDSFAELVGNQDIKSEKVHANFAKRLVSIDNRKNNIVDFCNEPKKLKVIYLLKRHDNLIGQNEGFCKITDIPASEALILLLQNSILGSAYKALGKEQTRVILLAKLLNKIQFKQISFSSGKDNLRYVCEKIKEDLSRV